MKQFVQRAGGRIGLWGGLLAVLAAVAVYLDLKPAKRG